MFRCVFNAKWRMTDYERRLHPCQSNRKIPAEETQHDRFVFWFVKNIFYSTQGMVMSIWLSYVLEVAQLNHKCVALSTQPCDSTIWMRDFFHKSEKQRVSHFSINWENASITGKTQPLLTSPGSQLFMIFMNNSTCFSLFWFNTLLQVGGLEHEFHCSIQLGISHHPNWLSLHDFIEG